MYKKVLIIGGNLFNKGAQAMTFISVSELRKREPGAKIVLLSTKDYLKNEEEKKKYNFEILPFTFRDLLYELGGFYWLFSSLIGLKKKRNDDESIRYRIHKAIRNADIMIDISGFALSSQWGIVGCITYLYMIKLMSKKRIKTMLMPQSFGPFDFKGIKKFFVDYNAKRYLKYPTIIFAREKEGYEILKNRYKLKNVHLSPDLVLQSSGLDERFLFKPGTHFQKLPQIKDKSVAILPNIRVFANCDTAELISKYDVIISYLLEMGKNVYLIWHSTEDYKVCIQIKENFKTIEKVILMTQELSCLEYERIVASFDYIVASRYHSIVHAYKQGIPCIAIGWAVKYYELLNLFNQSKYVIDIRKGLNTEMFCKLLDDMEEKYPLYNRCIEDKVKEIKKENCFKFLDELSG